VELDSKSFPGSSEHATAFRGVCRLNSALHVEQVRDVILQNRPKYDEYLADCRLLHSFTIDLPSITTPAVAAANSTSGNIGGSIAQQAATGNLSGNLPSNLPGTLAGNLPADVQGSQQAGGFNQGTAGGNFSQQQSGGFGGNIGGQPNDQNGSAGGGYFAGEGSGGIPSGGMPPSGGMASGMTSRNGGTHAKAAVDVAYTTYKDTFGIPGREFVVVQCATHEMLVGGREVCVLASMSLPEATAEKLVPHQSKKVRGKVVIGGYVIERDAPGQDIKVTLVNRIDLAGRLPTMIVNMVQKSQPATMLHKIKNLLNS
jgi:hypothetical protein